MGKIRALLSKIWAFLRKIFFGKRIMPPKPLHIALLELLEVAGVGRYVDIKDFIKENYSISANENTGLAIEAIVLFLEDMEDRKAISSQGWKDLAWIFVQEDDFNIPIPVIDNETDRKLNYHITSAGLDMLNQYRFSVMADNLNKISIRNIWAQLILGIISAIAIGITTIYAVMVFYKDDPPNLILIRKSLQQQERILDSIRLSQKGINTSLENREKKTNSKSP